MFLRKKKLELSDDSPSLLSLAARLGVERRHSVRVNYPENTQVCKLPEAFFERHKLKIANISVGGCCVLDPEEIMGPSIGHDIELTLRWSSGDEVVKARILSRVDLRRHIQFLDLSLQRQAWLGKSLSTGARGLDLHRHLTNESKGPTVMAAELWSSYHSDSLVLENDSENLGQLQLLGESYHLTKSSWPKKNGQNCTRVEFEQIILFLANIPNPTPVTRSLMATLEMLFVMGGV